MDTNKSKMQIAVEDFLEQRMYSFQKQPDGTYIEEICADYRDEMSVKSAGEILRDADTEAAFYDYIDECYLYTISDMEGELESDARKALTDDDGPFPEGFTDEEDEEFIDLLREYVVFQPPYDHYLKQEFCVNIMIDTGDGNYDFTLNAHYPCYYGGDAGDQIDEKAGIVWLAKTQGYTEEQLRKALDEGDMANPKGFLQSMRVEMANMASHMQVVTFLVKMDFKTLMRLNRLIKLQDRNGRNYDASKNPECGDIILGKETMCGLYDYWSGGGSVLEVELEKDVRVPVKYIYSALPDGAGPGYSIENVYGMCKSAWEDTVKEICELKEEVA